MKKKKEVAKKKIALRKVLFKRNLILPLRKQTQMGDQLSHLQAIETVINVSEIRDLKSQEVQTTNQRGTVCQWNYLSKRGGAWNNDQVRTLSKQKLQPRLSWTPRSQNYLTLVGLQPGQDPEQQLD